jgi:hypothetical protein
VEKAAAPADDWHRQQATSAYNRVWQLIEEGERSADRDEEMLRTAFASRYHWEQVGGDEERAVGDWQIAHVASLLGLADLALRYATAALTRTQACGGTGWLLASALEGMARAHAVAGDRAERDRYMALARAALATEDDAEDRAIIESQLETIPR